MEKLLIVDDEEIELDGMAELIDWQKYGYELVGTAINGKRGLALLEEKNRYCDHRHQDAGHGRPCLYPRRVAAKLRHGVCSAVRLRRL